MQAFEGWDMSHFDHDVFELCCACFTPRVAGEPYSGDLYLRFDEGPGLIPRGYSTG